MGIEKYKRGVGSSKEYKGHEKEVVKNEGDKDNTDNVQKGKI